MEEYTEEEIELMKNLFQRIQILEEINKALKDEQRFLKNQIEELDRAEPPIVNVNLN